MRNGVNMLLLLGVAAAVPLVLSTPARAESGEVGPPDSAPPRQGHEPTADRWIPSLSISGGANFQNMDGSAASVLFEDMTPDPIPLQPAIDGDDLSVAPFVGVGVEVASPQLPVKTRPRIFIGAEILPTFSAERRLASQGEADCIRGPEPQAPCARDEMPGSRRLAFGEEDANGEGTRTVAEIDTLVFGANLGLDFPVRAGQRTLRIKPSAAWISYEVDAAGLVVDATCEPPEVCTDVFLPGMEEPAVDGFLRETALSASDSQRFHGVGGGLDLGVETGRFGPIGTSLFLGARFYRVLGDRTIRFGTSESYDDLAGTDTAAARFEVEVAPWLYRAHVGIRFHWLGGR